MSSRKSFTQKKSRGGGVIPEPSLWSGSKPILKNKKNIHGSVTSKRGKTGSGTTRMSEPIDLNSLTTEEFNKLLEEADDVNKENAASTESKMKAITSANNEIASSDNIYQTDFDSGETDTTTTNHVSGDKAKDENSHSTEADDSVRHTHQPKQVDEGQLGRKFSASPHATIEIASGGPSNKKSDSTSSHPSSPVKDTSPLPQKTKEGQVLNETPMNTMETIMQKSVEIQTAHVSVLCGCLRCRDILCDFVGVLERHLETSSKEGICKQTLSLDMDSKNSGNKEQDMIPLMKGSDFMIPVLEKSNLRLVTETGDPQKILNCLMDIFFTNEEMSKMTCAGQGVETKGLPRNLALTMKAYIRAKYDSRVFNFDAELFTRFVNSKCYLARKAVFKINPQLKEERAKKLAEKQKALENKIREEDMEVGVNKVKPVVKRTPKLNPKYKTLPSTSTPVKRSYPKNSEASTSKQCSADRPTTGGKRPKRCHEESYANFLKEYYQDKKLTAKKSLSFSTSPSTLKQKRGPLEDQRTSKKHQSFNSTSDKRTNKQTHTHHVHSPLKKRNKSYEFETSPFKATPHREVNKHQQHMTKENLMVEYERPSQSTQKPRSAGKYKDNHHSVKQDYNHQNRATHRQSTEESSDSFSDGAYESETHTWDESDDQPPSPSQ